MSVLAKLNGWLLVASAIVVAASFWNRNNVPVLPEHGAELRQEPEQRRTRKQPFSVDYEGVTYEVEPQYNYDLYGLVVSYRYHDGTSTMHRLSNDHLNMADFCIIWGDNLDNERIDQISFWNGIFTCNVKTTDSEAWSRFRMEQLSNNHLLSDDEWLRRQINKVRVGDQIRIQGWLANYGQTGAPKRGTSTTRIDSGDGACETIFVDQFQLIARGHNPWRTSLYVSLITLTLGILIHFAIPFRAR